MQFVELFSIPIYGTTEAAFRNKWKQRYDTLHKKYPLLDSAKLEFIKSRESSQRLWKYNQIIGYIKISFSAFDIWFDLYLLDCKRYVFDSKIKHFYVNRHINGCHFRYVDMSDSEIKEEIFKRVFDIKKVHAKTRFIDIDAFNLFLKYTNIKQMLDDLSDKTPS